MLGNFSPKFLSLCSVGQKKSHKIPSKFPTKFSKFPCEKSKKIHRRASAGAQGTEIITAIFQGPTSKSNFRAASGLYQKYYTTKAHYAQHFPDPPILAFFWAKKKKARTPRKKQGFLFLPIPETSWKGSEKRTKKQGKTQNEKSEENEKSKDWRVRVLFQPQTLPSC